MSSPPTKARARRGLPRRTASAAATKKPRRRSAPTTPGLRQRANREAVRVERLLVAPATLEVRNAEVVDTDPPDGVGAELLQTHPPEVVSVASKAGEMRGTRRNAAGAEVVPHGVQPSLRRDRRKQGHRGDDPGEGEPGAKRQERAPFQAGQAVEERQCDARSAEDSGADDDDDQGRSERVPPPCRGVRAVDSQ